jgi:SAM-dependent methyltransferase
MSVADKDFAPIVSDYEFFMRHSTEAENDLADFRTALEQFLPDERAIRMLDFGCGTGEFTYLLLECLGWSPDRLQLALIEPVENQCRQAAERLQRFTVSPIEQGRDLRRCGQEGFDIIFANHVLYYVSDLDVTLAQLVGALNPGGLFLSSIAGRDNALIRFWEKGFGAIGQSIPYWLAEDVGAALKKIGVSYEKGPSRYEVSFPDSEENRMKILRFLFADHLSSMPGQELLTLFDDFVHSRCIEMRTRSIHYMVRSAAT